MEDLDGARSFVELGVATEARHGAECSCAAARSTVTVDHAQPRAAWARGRTPEFRAQYNAALKDALRAGYEILSAGGEAMDAAVAAAASMEDALNFNFTQQVYIF